MKTQSKKTIYIALFGLQILFLVIAFAITLIRGESISSIFSHSVSPLPVFLFLLAGIAVGFFMAHFLKLPAFSKAYEKISHIILGCNLNISDYFIIALMSGFCEEILFRGVLQPMWGIWIASIVFVLVHGYFNPLDRKSFPTALIMLLIALALGVIYNQYGIVPAIAFHFGLDFAEMLRVRALAKR